MRKLFNAILLTGWLLFLASGAAVVVGCFAALLWFWFWWSFNGVSNLLVGLGG